MYKIGIFYGSDTGDTKKISYYINNKLIYYFNTKIFDISNSSINDFLYFEILILGTSTWYHGELQYDWDNFLLDFKKIDFSNKIVSFFGCGNQIDYSNCFCDGVYKLYNIVNKKNSKIIGYWPSNGYKFNFSKSLLNKNYFIGLMIDEKYQKNLTKIRLNKWISYLILNIYNLKKINK